MKLPGPITRAVRGIALRVLRGRIKDIAEKPGDHPRLHRLYWKLAGFKTWTGFALGVVAAGLAGAGEFAGAAGLATVGAFLMSVGLVDAAWRQSIPAAVLASPVYRLAAANGAEVATVMAAVGASLTACDPETAEVLARLSLSCDVASRIALGLAAVFVWLGIYDAAGAAPAPKTPPEEPK